ncbi:MAG: acyl-CoA dehydrogenase family protein [Actinomycetota bacterium]
MNFGLSDEERSFRDEVRAFVDEVGAADMAALRAEMRELEVERYTPGFHRRIAERGWVGLGWPGRPATVTERFILHEELDSASLPTYGLEINEAIGWMIARHGPDALAAAHLPRIIDGSWAYAGAYSEPEAGSDLLALKTRAVLEGANYRVNGSKLWTSSAHLADWIFALVRTDATAERQRGLSVLLIDAKGPGVEIRPVRVMGGWRVNAVFFDDALVPASNVVGAPNDGWRVLAEALNVERSMSFGGREGRLLVARLLRRFAGRADQLGEARLEEMGRFAMELEVERLLNLRIAAMGERDEVPAAEASMNKVVGSELAQRIAQWAVDVLAPESLYAESDADPLAAVAEEMLRVSTVYTIIGGTSEVQRNTIAQRGLGLPRAD